MSVATRCGKDLYSVFHLSHRDDFQSARRSRPRAVHWIRWGNQVMSRKTDRSDAIGEEMAAADRDRPYGGDVFPATPTHTAAYIQDMARELHLMAGRAELSFLAYLLEIATQEAESQKLRRCRRRTDS